MYGNLPYWYLCIINQYSYASKQSSITVSNQVVFYWLPVVIISKKCLIFVLQANCGVKNAMAKT